MKQCQTFILGEYRNHCNCDCGIVKEEAYFTGKELCFLDGIFKSKDITTPTKVTIVKL